MSYTPGPWIAVHDKKTQVLRQDGFPIATCHSSKFDALLMAAAPELLDALEKCEVLLRKWSGAECTDSEGGVDPNMYKCWEEIRNSIKKAKGE